MGVERTLGWLSRARRPNRNHEHRPDPTTTQTAWWAELITLTRCLAKERLNWPEFRPQPGPAASLNETRSRSSHPCASSA